MMVFYSLYSETLDYVEIYRATGQPLAHFNSLWNVLDAISISMNLASISIWVYYIVLQQGFDMKVRLPSRPPAPERRSARNETSAPALRPLRMTVPTD